MKIFKRLSALFQTDDGVPRSPHAKAAPPLREFVYLDEVSLRSLLSSQKGEITEGTSEQAVDGLISEISGKSSVDAQIAKAELASRFQTTNSSTLQTSRKATVQSWFRDLHTMHWLRLVSPPNTVRAPPTVEALISMEDTAIVVKAAELVRGALVEFRVRLAADPVFRLGTLVTEFSGMAEDFPGMFSINNALSTLNNVQPVNKILQRLLAGLIPVRARALEYSVICVEGDEYVVHKDALTELDLPSRPLEIVGVTEHLAYWKDIRRVLFSDAEFTMLCRVSRSGLHDSWTPVKLADLFRDLAPDLVDQMNAAGGIPLNGSSSTTKSDSKEEQLEQALNTYRDAFLRETDVDLTLELTEQIEAVIFEARSRTASASDQRTAFTLVEQALSAATGSELDGAKNLMLRDEARLKTGLPLFPSLSGSNSAGDAMPVQRTTGMLPRILDVEVVAIYW